MFLEAANTGGAEPCVRRDVLARSAQVMECICKNDMASTVQECTARLGRLEQCLVSCPGECKPDDLRRLLHAVLRLCISRFTDARLASGDKYAAQILESVAEDFEKRDAGYQYWGNYNAFADALANMNEESRCKSRPQRLGSAGNYAVLLRPPTDLPRADLSVFIEFLKAVEETKAALVSAEPEGGNDVFTLFTLLAWLSDGMVKPCVSWLGKKACANIGTCFQAMSDRFEKVYASTNLHNAVTFVEQFMLNNCADFSHGVQQCDAWCEKHLSAPRAGRLRERGQLHWVDVETEVFTACDELFAPAEDAEQAAAGAGKHGRDARMSPAATDTATPLDTDACRDARGKRHCKGIGAGAEVAGEPAA